MKSKYLNLVLSSALCVSGALAVNSVAFAGDKSAYITDRSGNIWRDSFGNCWRSSNWTPEKAIAACGGMADTADDSKDMMAEKDADADGVVDSKDMCPGTAAGASVDAKGCVMKPKDSDGDGVADSLDKCSATPAGAKVDAKGCKVAPIDTDGDGIVDALDSCPATKAGVKVDAKGCELDTDKDGVADSMDRCSNTIAGVRVDVRGCEIKEVIVLKGVTFNSGSDDLTGGSATALDEVAATLKKHSDMKVEVGGYTDNTGSTAYNVRLSQQRAQAVVDYLVSEGVNAANLSAKGYGPENPIADNGTAAGRAKNRRVELQIIE